MITKDLATYRLKPCLVLHRGHHVLCFLIFENGGIQCVAVDVFRPVGPLLGISQALSLLMPVNQAAIRYMRRLLELPADADAPNAYLEEPRSSDAMGTSDPVVNGVPVSISIEA